MPTSTRPPFVATMRCLVCGREYAPGELAYVCPEHGDDGVLDIMYDYERLGAVFTRESLAANPERSMWRYRPLLPVLPMSPVPPLPVGATPLVDCPRAASALGVARLLLKDETREPTASLKDRASAMAVVKAAETGAPVITTASTGNAAAALAGICASTGQKNVIFVPASAPQAKIAQLLAYGATVLLVEGSYDEAFELCLDAARRLGWYNRSTGYNPYMTEGKKTAALEICEQMHWSVPDSVFVGVGDGSIIGGLHKGFVDLKALGFIERLPRLIGVQAAGSDYLVQAFETDEDVLTKPAIAAATIADSISAGLPRDRLKAMRAVRETGGAFVRVSDEAILAAIPLLARLTGVFAEPAGAASLAGLIQARETGLVGPEDSVCLLVTGSGLKDIAAVVRACADTGVSALRLAPELAAVENLVAAHPERFHP